MDEIQSDTQQTPPAGEKERPSVMVDLNLNILNPSEILIQRDKDQLCLTVGDRSFFQVEARRAFPLSQKNKYVVFFDAELKEIGLIRDVRELPLEQRTLLDEELDKRYFTARIRKVRACKEEFGTFKLDVETDKGPRVFNLRNLRENVLRLPPNRVIMTDVHGNRFEIRDASRLDAKSLATIAKII